MGLLPCCVDTRKTRHRLPESTESGKVEAAAKTPTAEYEGRANTKQANKELIESIFEVHKSQTNLGGGVGVGKLGVIVESQISRQGFTVDSTYLLTVTPACPETGDFAEHLPCYPPGYQPIRVRSGTLNYLCMPHFFGTSTLILCNNRFSTKPRK